MRANAKTQGGARRAYLRGEGRHQPSWLPATIDDDIGDEKPVRL